MTKKVLMVAGLGLVIYVLWKTAHAASAGVSVISAIKHPTLDPRIAELADHPERQQTRHGAGHFV